ncbi:MAG: hypothetical protein IJ509_02570 [Bacilli bacterium]|nr:hypothetical protein [Bacilli bacterium]
MEINSYSYAGLIVKNLAYLFQLFGTSFKRGEKYNENLLVMQININCFKDINYNEITTLETYRIINDRTHELYVKNVIIFELNVAKCKEVYYNEKNKGKILKHVRWGALIYYNNINDIPEITKGILSFEERKLIMDKLSELTHEDLFMTEEEALEWAEWERNSIKAEAKKEGLKEGIEQNTKNTIIAMLENNIDLETISKITNKTIEEINLIKEEQ